MLSVDPYQQKQQQLQKLRQDADTAAVNKQIEQAKAKAKKLYEEIVTVKQKIQDSTLQSNSVNVSTIPQNSCKLKLYNTLTGHLNKVAKICWNTESSRILSASQDGFMIIWDAVTGFKKQAIQLDNPWVLTCSLSPNEKMVASAGLDNACTIFKIKADTSNNPVQQTNKREGVLTNSFPMQAGFYQSVQSIFKGHTAYISDCEFIGNNSIVTASGDMTCSLWDVTKGSKSRDFIDHVGDVLCLAIFPKDILLDNLFISGSSDGYVKVWDLRQATPTQSFSISNSDVNCAKIFPDGNAFAIGSDDGLVRLFDLRSDCGLANYSLQLALINSQTALEGLPQLHLPTRELSDVAANKIVTKASGTTDKANTLATSTSNTNTSTNISNNTNTNNNNNNNNNQQAQNCENESLRGGIFSKSTNSDRASINSRASVLENQGVFSLDFGKSGRFLYACYSEYGCVVWDTLKNDVIGTLGNDHLNKISNVSVSPDGIGLATGSWDATIKVWSV